MPELCVGVIGDVTFRRNAEAFDLIVSVLGSVLYFQNRFHYLPSKSERSKT